MAALTNYDIILKPVLTEKSMGMMEGKEYTFLVHPEANKSQIKEAKTKKAIVKLTADSKEIEIYEGL